MSYQLPPDVADLVKQYMSTGIYSSEDEVLREALYALGHFAHTPEETRQEYDETVAAVREGLSDIEQGRVRDLRDVIKQAEKR